MKSTKTRRLIVVDDIIGSGSRMIKFLDWLSRNATIRSWLSYGFVRFYPVTFAATEAGRLLVENHPYVAGVRFNRLVTRGDINWNREQIETYESLCKRYADRTSRPFWPLGFRHEMTTMVFQHKCPNTTPAIFWAGSKKWHALFNIRPELAFDEWPQSQDEDQRTRLVLRSLHQTRLSELQWRKFVSAEAGMRFVLLAVLAKRRLDIEHLGAVMNVGEVSCRKLVMDCVQFGWITTEYRVTEEGLAELSRARELRLLPEEELRLTETIYVPQSFRGASG